MKSTDNSYQKNPYKPSERRETAHHHSGHAHRGEKHNRERSGHFHRNHAANTNQERGAYPMEYQENMNQNEQDRQSRWDRPSRDARESGKDYGSHPGRGDRDHNGRGRRGGRGEGYSPLCAEDGTYLLMVGSYSCTRHKGEERLALQQAGKMGFLCLQEIDWITGDYMPQIEEAAAEVTEQFHVKKLILFGGCQVELQSLDTAMLTAKLTAALGIPVEFHRGCHLVGYGDALNRQEETR